MTREEFIKNIKVPDGTMNGTELKWTNLQKDVSEAFENNWSLIAISPRQTGRTTSLIINLLYELYISSCVEDFVETIFVGRSVADTKQISYRFKETIELNPFIDNLKVTRYHITGQYHHAICFKSINSIQNIPLEERRNKRLIISDAAFIEDSFPIFKLIEGWRTVHIETVTGKGLKTFNSSFIRDLIDYNGVGVFDIIKYNWFELGLSRKWYDDQKAWMTEEIFKREILLEWD